MDGFWAGRGTGTTALEVKLLQDTTATREVVLFEVLLDLQKVHDALDQDICLDIFAACGFMVTRASRYFRHPF